MIIKVHVHAHAHDEKIEEIGLDEYNVWIAAIPTEGKANEALIDLLSDYFNIGPSKIHIKSGSKSTHKLIEME
jgi:uncharacterized protein (TIGR00251 family)